MNFLGVNNILVIKLRHIGDVLLTVPVFRALRENFPHSRIAALVNSGTEEVISSHPLIDEVIVFDRNIKKRNFFQRCAKEWSFVARLRRQAFDMTVDLTGGDRTAIFSVLSGARYRLAHDLGRNGFWGKARLYTHLAKKNGHQHMVLQNLEVVRQFGIDTGNLDVDLFIPEDARRFMRDVFEENKVSEDDVKVHVHPPSRWLFKCWQDERMAEVITWLLEQGIKVIVTSAPDVKELNKAKKILSLVEKNSGGELRPIDLCGRTSIKELAAIATAADLFFGVDSAPMHIAAAVGTPVVALFGPSHVNRWAPWSSELSSLKTREDWAKCYRNDCYYLGKHVVAQRKWQCFPCGRDGCEGSKRSKCLEDISVKEVKDLILARIPRIRRDEAAYS